MRNHCLYQSVDFRYLCTQVGLIQIPKCLKQINPAFNSMVFQGIQSRHRRILGKLAEKIHQSLDAEEIT